MAKSRANLYGNVPDKSPVALVLIDVINDLSFQGARGLLRQIGRMAERLASLKARAERHKCAVIYVNDNFGKWRSDFKTLVEHCRKPASAGRELADLLRPSERDYFVLKPAHSGFYSTALDLLLKHLESKTLILTGIATNSCVLFTANDAFLRGYEICIPSDCVAANSQRLSKQALKQMQTVLKAEIRKSTSLPWRKWLRTI